MEKKKEIIFYEAGNLWLRHVSYYAKTSTIVKYRNILQSYVYQELGDLNLSDITQSFLENHAAHLLRHGGCRSNGLSPKTIQDILSVIKNVIKYSEKEGYEVSYAGNPIPLQKQYRSIRVFDRSEQQKLIAYLCENQTPYTIGIYVCLCTGMRLGEICALQWKDVFPEQGYLYVQSTIQRLQALDASPTRTQIMITMPKSPKSVRIIPLPDILVEEIRRYPVPRIGYFLTGREDIFIEPRSMQRNFKLILKQLEIPDAGFHVLRHTFATRCVELGFDTKTLSELLGHSSVNITLNRYVHSSMDQKKVQMQLLNHYLENRR